MLGALEVNKSQSAFVNLSGHSDDFESVRDLCDTVQSGVFLKHNVIPHLDIYLDEGMAPLNTYLFDFFCYGSLDPLEVANQISHSDSWFLLNEFFGSCDNYCGTSELSRPGPRAAVNLLGSYGCW